MSTEAISQRRGTSEEYPSLPESLRQRAIHALSVWRIAANRSTQPAVSSTKNYVSLLVFHASPLYNVSFVCPFHTTIECVSCRWDVLRGVRQ